MSNTETVTLAPGPSKGPSIEESYEALKAEGILSDDTDGALLAPQDAQGGAEGEQEGADENRPSGLPEKFKSVDDLIKAYEELEKKQSSKTKTDAADEGVENAQASDEEVAAAEEATKKAGLDLNAVSAEWYENQGLTEETYAKLEAAGYPRTMVDIYIEGLTARTQSTVTEVYKTVGSKETYDEMIDWAIDNLSPAEQKAFDKAVNSNDKATAMLAVEGLKAKWSTAKAAESSQEPEVQVNGRGQSNGGGYETMDDYMADLSDPRYDQNETFRRQVMKKLAATKNF